MQTFWVVLGLWFGWTQCRGQTTTSADTAAEALFAPGLVAEYRSLLPNRAEADKRGEVARIEPKPAIAFQTEIGSRDSVHPSLPPGPFRIEWSGWIDIREAKPIRWGAYVAGRLRWKLEDKVLLETVGENPQHWVLSPGMAVSPGLHRVAIEFESSSNPEGSRLQLWWESDDFLREPIPSWRWKHRIDRVPSGLAQEQAAEMGRRTALSYGCAQCHRETFPELEPRSPGPSLHDLGQRVDRGWLVRKLMSPRSAHPGSIMPELFSETPEDQAKAILIADYLLNKTGPALAQNEPLSNHRPGRDHFLGLGCIACHLVPDMDPAMQTSLVPRSSLVTLQDRFSVESLTGFLLDPYRRYPDGRMPHLVSTPSIARNLAAYLLTTAGKPSVDVTTTPQPLLAEPAQSTIEATVRRLGVGTANDAGRALSELYGCRQCHPGLDESPVRSLPIRDLQGGCLSARANRRFHLSTNQIRSLQARLQAGPERGHHSTRYHREVLWERAGCQKCHARDTDRSSPLEIIGREVWAAHLARLPFQRTPALTHAWSKYQPAHLSNVVAHGVSGLRPSWYSYRMPSYGGQTPQLIRAILESDGEAFQIPAQEPEADDPSWISVGQTLVGFEGYSCVACHLWKGRAFMEPDPSAAGPDLASVGKRLHQTWFDRWLEDPQRIHPGTPMPAFFARGSPVSQRELLGGDAEKQKAAIWSYLRNSATAPSPEPRPSEPVMIPPESEGPLIGQIPVEIPKVGWVESISILTAAGDLAVFDIPSGLFRHAFTNATLLRNPNGNRSFQLAGTPWLQPTNLTVQLQSAEGREIAQSFMLEEYQRMPQGILIRGRYRFRSVEISITQTLTLPLRNGDRQASLRLQVTSIPGGGTLELPLPEAQGTWTTERGNAVASDLRLRLETEAAGTLKFPLPGSGPFIDGNSISTSANLDWIPSGDRITNHHGLQRPGYQAYRYPMPKTASGEDRIMPTAMAIDPKTDRIYIASLKHGDIVSLDPPGSGFGSEVSTPFRDRIQGLFQDALSMQHDGTGLHVLHRRNLTRITDSNGDGLLDRFERLAALPHAVANAYDWGYGLVREPTGSFLLSFAPHANQRMAGSGAAMRWTPGQRHEGIPMGRWDEVAWGFRNPLGWVTGPEGSVFFSDNQGEWIGSSKLGHLVQGSFNGYPNHAQLQHTNHPSTPATVWVPYNWARSINGIAWENTGGKFGPFTGQLFMAELMNGGAILRANVEKVNGVYQGACFPFWGSGLLGPLVMAFDSLGHLYVGSLTMPNWMGQPDRGAVYRIQRVGDLPLELCSIHVAPAGFRVVFTQPVDPASVNNPSDWKLEQYRYEYTGAYGSPELDRRRVDIRRINLEPDGQVADLLTEPLKRGWIYSIRASKLRSPSGQDAANNVGVYTMNEIPVQ